MRAWREDWRNRPVPSSKNPHFQNEARCTTFLVKMSFICMRIKNDFHIKGWAPTLVLKERPGGTRKWPSCSQSRTFGFCDGTAWTPSLAASYPYWLLLTLKIQLRKTCENCTNSRKLYYEQCQNKMCTLFVKQLLVFLVREKTQRVKRRCTIEYHHWRMKLKRSEIDYFTMSLLHFVLNSCYIMGGAGVTVILSPPTKTAMREGPT